MEFVHLHRGSSYKHYFEFDFVNDVIFDEYDIEFFEFFEYDFKYRLDNFFDEFYREYKFDSVNNLLILDYIFDGQYNFKYKFNREYEFDGFHNLDDFEQYEYRHRFDNVEYGFEYNVVNVNYNDYNHNRRGRVRWI